MLHLGYLPDQRRRLSGAKNPTEAVDEAAEVRLRHGDRRLSAHCSKEGGKLRVSVVGPFWNSVGEGVTDLQDHHLGAGRRRMKDNSVGDLPHGRHIILTSTAQSRALVEQIRALSVLEEDFELLSGFAFATCRHRAVDNGATIDSTRHR